MIFLISTTSWDSLAEAKRFFLVCDQCFPASTSRFNQDIISPPGETRAGVPSSFHFPAFTFCLTLFPSTHPFPEVLGCYWSLPCERSLPARGWRETVWCFQKKKKMFDWSTMMQNEGQSQRKANGRDECNLFRNIHRCQIKIWTSYGFECTFQCAVWWRRDFDTWEQRHMALDSEGKSVKF